MVLKRGFMVYANYLFLQTQVFLCELQSVSKLVQSSLWNSPGKLFKTSSEKVSNKPFMSLMNNSRAFSRATHISPIASVAFRGACEHTVLRVCVRVQKHVSHRKLSHLISSMGVKMTLQKTEQHTAPSTAADTHTNTPKRQSIHERSVESVQNHHCPANSTTSDLFKKTTPTTLPKLTHRDSQQQTKVSHLQPLIKATMHFWTCLKCYI